MSRSLVIVLVVLCCLICALGYVGYLLYKHIAHSPTISVKTHRKTSYAQTLKVPISNKNQIKILIARAERLITTTYSKPIELHLKYMIMRCTVSIRNPTINVELHEKLSNVTIGRDPSKGVLYVVINKGFVNLRYIFYSINLKYRNFSELIRENDSNMLICIRGSVNVGVKPIREERLSLGFCNLTKVKHAIQYPVIRYSYMLANILNRSRISAFKYMNNSSKCVQFSGLLNMSKFLRQLINELKGRITNPYLVDLVEKFILSSLSTWNYVATVCFSKNNIIVVKLSLINANRSQIAISVNYVSVIDRISIGTINEKLIRELEKLPRGSITGFIRLVENMILGSTSLF